MPGTTDCRRKSPHQQRIEKFMALAKQAVPTEPTLPDEKTLLLRAKLVFEEALELVVACGYVPIQHPEYQLKFEFQKTFEPNLTEIVDGCADVSVVTTGTLSALGLADEALLELVDANNLAKFGPGHSFRADGKLIKPPGHTKPNFAQAIEDQRRQAVADRANASR